MRATTGLVPDQAFSADFINQYYDHSTDKVILSPVLAFTVPPTSPITLSDEYVESAWLDRDEATRRMAFAGQRWAIRHIEEVIGLGGAEAELYRIDPSDSTK